MTAESSTSSPSMRNPKTSGSMTVPDLKAYCEELKERIQQQAGIRLIEIDFDVDVVPCYEFGRINFTGGPGTVLCWWFFFTCSRYFLPVRSRLPVN